MRNWFLNRGVYIALPMIVLVLIIWSIRDRRNQTHEMSHNEPSSKLEIIEPTPPKTPAPFAPGEVVRLKSGGPLMTVAGNRHRQDGTWLTWAVWSNDAAQHGVREADFNPVLLERKCNCDPCTCKPGECDCPGCAKKCPCLGKKLIPTGIAIDEEFTKLKPRQRFIANHMRARLIERLQHDGLTLAGGDAKPLTKEQAALLVSKLSDTQLYGAAHSVGATEEKIGDGGGGFLDFISRVFAWFKAHPEVMEAIFKILMSLLMFISTETGIPVEELLAM